jgi:hypothetical protein
VNEIVSRGRAVQPSDEGVHVPVTLRLGRSSFLEQNQWFSNPIDRNPQDAPVRRVFLEIEPFLELLAFLHGSKPVQYG